MSVGKRGSDSDVAFVPSVRPQRGFRGIVGTVTVRAYAVKLQRKNCMVSAQEGRFKVLPSCPAVGRENCQSSAALRELDARCEVTPLRTRSLSWQGGVWATKTLERYVAVAGGVREHAGNL